MKHSKVTAIVLAAGQGKRMKTSIAKQFLELGNKPILYYSLKAFEDSVVDDIVLVTREDQIEICREIIVSYNFKKVVSIVEGGKERYESVYNALEDIKLTDYVLIHDGARPFITSSLIEDVIQTVKRHNACIVGVPVKDTIKTVDNNEIIKKTPDRKTLWAAQTPQAFDFPSIKEAYGLLRQESDKERELITDDAMVYETYLKRPVKMIYGDYKNLKITTEEDYILAKALYENYCVY